MHARKNLLAIPSCCLVLIAGSLFIARPAAGQALPDAATKLKAVAKVAEPQPIAVQTTPTGSEVPTTKTASSSPETNAGGTVAKTDITIPKGSSVAETTFQPLAEGKSVIKAVVGEGLIVETEDVEFKYAYIYFWGIAALGGFIGGVIRNAVGSDHSAKTVVVHCIGGCATGLLVYLLLPLMVSLSLKPVNLQNASKVFEAFAWGFIGGGTGTALLGKIISSTQHPKTANH